METETRRDVGPVLVAGPTARAVVAAIEALNEGATILDRSGYLRVRVPGRCVVTRAAIEAFLGRPFELRTDLEPLMTSFQGKLTLSDQEAWWE
jgi:hypothetical protein